jgi:L-rhamnose mutarotase
MKRKAFVMSVHAGMEKEYEKRHSPIWPELESTLKEHGVLSYSIFLNPETRELFGYAEIEDDELWSAIADTPICKKWWAYMKDLMPCHADNRPVSRELKEVFHIDASHGKNLENKACV